MNTATQSKPMTKKAQAEAEKQEALTFLRETEGLVEGRRVYTMVTSRSSSGMSRNVRLFIAAVSYPHEGNRPGRKPEASIVEITHNVARALGLRKGKNDDIVVGGCGFDAGHHVVMSLSYALFGRNDPQREGGYALKHERM